MKILILGIGKMGQILSDSLCLQHEVAVYDRDIRRLQYVFNTRRLTSLDEIREFEPELLINAVTLKYTIETFHQVLPYLSESCIISDIASVKTGLKEFYENCGHPYVSTHPMFGPTFANLRELKKNHAIIITEGDEQGKNFFRDFYGSLGLNLHEYTFQGHDQTIAYSLSIPFVSTMVFAACMKHQDAPGTTFTKHLHTAQGVLSEDDFLLSEILFNPYTPEQVERIVEELTHLLELVKSHDNQAMSHYFAQLRRNIDLDPPAEKIEVKQVEKVEIKPIEKIEPIVEIKPVEKVEVKPVVHSAKASDIKTFGTPVDSIRKAISIGDRMIYQKELFGGDGDLYNAELTALDAMDSYESAHNYLQSRYPHWDENDATVSGFLRAVRRRFL